MQTVLSQFPLDPLAPGIKAKIAELKARIAKRAADLAAAQARVKDLLGQCRIQRAAALDVKQRSIVFTEFGNLEMNTLMAGERDASAHERRANAAKEKALQLLKSVPDPGGVLAKAAETCDSGE
ncbi:MAG: hypothetical protein FJ096_14905 [Deltaproteobacteria bacterium]|nr:hypothetical protein [Deltaproteobacteria bacterium]